MKRNLAVILVVCICIGAMLAGCAAPKVEEAPSTEVSEQPSEAVVSESATAEESEVAATDITIGFIPMTLNNEYFITMVAGAQMKADELGVKLEIQAGDSHSSAEAQLEIVENMITSGVKAICVVPSSSEGMLTALKKCEEANIPVINLDTRLNAELLEENGVQAVPFIGTDNYTGAKTAGEYALENMPEGTKVAILTGIEGQENAAFRRNGFYEAVEGKFDVVAEQTANWEVDEAYSVTQNILQANPDIELIFASNDGMAIGAMRVVQELKKQDSIKVIGFDAISEAVNMVKEGTLLGTVAQYPGEMGILGVQAAVDAINGKTIEMNVNTGAELITSANVDDFMEYLKQFS